MPIFVVHEHHARKLHYDLRLEMEGVLKSWAIPKGPTLSPKDKRLAVLVDDHPIEYADFEGVIPEGSYGAGPVLIWDKGIYKLVKGSLDEGILEVSMEGRILKGLFVLTKLKNKKNDWLFVKKKDEYADYSFELKPLLSPEKAKEIKSRDL
ncbi:MAG: DNA polymerase ligase N-terminal domain-containing protein [Deltaproteobacteria bacterium]|nr:DNA polymerase ligase N-terminal domain-containing protein [Deltaproteobacteria bacterium]